jgi:Protein of unknown function (DUF3667)/Domain of unknown function (DUF4286)
MGPNDDNESVVYEVNLEADAAIAGPFDTWLRDHIADMLQFQGFLSAEILDDPGAPPGKIRRIVQYRLRDQAALDRYLRDEAPRMRQDGVDKFGDGFSAQRRILAHREEFIRGAVSTDNCLNCGEVLTGQHCSHCGQRAKVRVLSFHGMMRDLLGDILDFDSRVWRTLRPLALKPGVLTAEFLRGRRTHYSPPFRMYLILSVAFFLVASLGSDPGADLHIGPDSGGGAHLQIGDGGSDNDEGGAAAKDSPAPNAQPSRAAPSTAAPPVQAPRGAKGTATPAALDEERRKIIERIVAKLPEGDRKQARAEFEREFGGMTPEQFAPVSRLVDDPCSPDNFKLDIGRLGEKYAPRLRSACRKIVTDSTSFGRAVFENIPKMMFIFLPLIAALMFILCLGSGRYYIEHLLFFVHYHAFFFLAGICVVLLARLATIMQAYKISDVLHTVENTLIVVLIFYVPYYLYRAMRTVYGQGRFFTLAKMSLLVVGYLFFMTLTAVGLLFYTALTL